MAKYRHIFETMKLDIANAKYRDARRFPSEMELAHRFNVSRPTAARALRELQAIGLVDRRAGSGTFLRNAPPHGDRKEIGLLVGGLGNTEILDPICNEITREGQSQGMGVLWGDASGISPSAEQAMEHCQRYVDRRVAGVFFAPLENVPDREALNTRVAQTLRDAGIAVVLLDRDVLDFPRRSAFDLVGIDNFHAGFTLADHLARLGHRSFRFVARPHHPSTTDLRIAGCREALARQGLSLDASCVHFGDPADVTFVRPLIATKPDVILCANDRTAAIMIQTLSTIGVRPPADVAVVGFDDVKYATLLSTPLTTMRQPCQQIGQAAIRVMKDRLADPSLPARQILLTAELVIRQSCGAAAS